MASFSGRTALFAGDVLVAFLAPFLSLEYRLSVLGSDTADETFYLYAALSGISTLILLRTFGSDRANWRFFSSPDAFSAGFSIALGVLVTILVEYFLGHLHSLPRSVPLVQILIQSSAFIAPRFIARYAIARPIIVEDRASRVLLVGCNETAMAYLGAVRNLARGSIKVAAAITHDTTMVGHSIRGAPIIGDFKRFDDAIKLLKNHGIEVSRVVLAASDAEIDPATKKMILSRSAQLQIPLLDIHALFTEVTASSVFNELDVDSLSLRGVYWTLKRLIDFTGAGVLMLALSPLLALTAILVAIDLGQPVLFWQERYGRDGRRFRIYKFRTMREPRGRRGPAASDTARVTRLGQLLRATRIDEMPQLWNVIYGEMSFVGPRPLVREDQPEQYSGRLGVRPGLTGWAQVNGGRLLTPEEKGALDLWYIGHASFRLDAEIIFLTIKMILFGDRQKPKAIEAAREWLVTNGG